MDSQPKDIPDNIAKRVGGPFDGTEEYFDPEPDEVRYNLLHQYGIVDDSLVFSKKFPSGAVYRWHPEDRIWRYIGLPSPELREKVQKLFEYFERQTLDDVH